MPVYQVTNRKTHARAVIVAANERAAVELRPDGAVWRGDQWVVYKHAYGDFVRAPKLPCWPVGPDHACADLLARRAEERFDTEQVIAFDQDMTPRERGEGPAEWWDDDEEG